LEKEKSITLSLLPSRMEFDSQKTLAEHGLPIKFVEFPDKEVKGVVEIAASLGVKPEQVVKTLVMKGSSGNLYLCLVGGNAKILPKKLKKLLSESDVKMASPGEISEATGYQVGAIPAFGLKSTLRTLIDSSLEQFPELYVGTGVFGFDYVMSPQDLKIASGGEYADISDASISAPRIPQLEIQSKFSDDEFISVRDAIEKGEGTAAIRGWVYRERNSNKFAFIVVRDSSGIIQCVFSQEELPPDVWLAARKLSIESSLKLRGEIRKEPKAPTGYEIHVKDLEVVQFAEAFPITKDFSPEFLLDNRHLWLRSRKITAVLKIRDTVFQAFREYFRQNGFYEYHSPIFQGMQAEGGSTLFEVKYFNEKTYLAQTWQLYAEAGIFSLEKIFTIAPSFRAEKSKTSRHLTEYWHAEMEAAWASFKDVQDHGEGVIRHMVAKVLEKNTEELEILKRDISKLRPVVEKPFARMTYTDALQILKQQGMDIEWGKDLRTIEEDVLSRLYDTPIIVTHYPKKVKAFYMKEEPSNPDVVRGCDFIAPEGYGEIIGGSERESDPESIKKRLLEQGEDPSQYKFYLDTRIYGSVPHGGFGLGMERIISWVCGLDNIKDAIPFPRTMLRKSP